MNIINSERSEYLKEIEKNFHTYAFPDNVIVELSAFCNINCIQCANSDMTRKKGNMDIKTYKKIVDEIAEKNPSGTFWFAGFGETLFQPYKLYYMIKYAKNKGLENVYLNTNGMLLTEETSNLIIEAGLDRLIIGIDGYTVETYEKIKRLSKRDIVYSNVINLIKLKNKLNSQKPLVETQFIVMKENENEVELFRDFWTKQGANVKIRPRLNWIDGVESQNNYSNIDRIACGWALNTCPIVWNGDIVNCGCDMNGDNIWGNVLENSIEEIWNGKRKEFVEQHLSHDFDNIPDICKKCSDWAMVGTTNFDEKGNEYKKVHR